MINQFITHGLDKTNGVFIAGDKTEKPDLKDICCNSIKGIPAFLSLDPADGYVFVKQVFDCCTDTLPENSYFIYKTDRGRSGICRNLHCSPYCETLQLL